MFDSEKALVSAMIEGNNDAYREAIRQYQRPMKYLATSIAGEKIADEVVQEAWFSAMRAINRFEGRSSLKTWLLRIVANEAKTRLRKEKRMTSLEAMTEEDSEFSGRFDDSGHWLASPSQWDADSPDALLATDELKACMDELVSELPDMQGATLNLRERQGYSLKEICNILDVSESNVRVLLHRARVRLFRCIEQLDCEFLGPGWQCAMIETLPTGEERVCRGP